MKKNDYVSWLLGFTVIALSITVIIEKKLPQVVSTQTTSIKEKALTARLFDLGKILNVKINDSVVFFNRDNEILDIKKRLVDGPRLILVIRPDFCNSCIIDALDQLSLFTSKFGTGKAIVLIETDAVNQLKGIVSDFGISIESIAFRNGKLFNKSSNIHSPYFFILQPSGYTFGFFLPLENFSDITREYLLQLKDTYFSDSES